MVLIKKAIVALKNAVCFAICIFLLNGCWATGADTEADDIIGPIDNGGIDIDLDELSRTISNKGKKISTPEKTDKIGEIDSF